MNYKDFYCQLPIKDNNVKILDGILQNDTANIVHVRLMDGAEPFDFTGYTEVFIEILKPDGTKVQSCVTDDTTVTSNNPYSVQVVSPGEGRISFTLKSQATALTGTHFAEIFIMGGGKRLTSARINYHVGSILDDDVADVTSLSEYSSLQTLINRNSAIATAEQNRVDTETLRVAAETAREERIAEMEADVQEYLDSAEGYVSQTQSYMAQALEYAELAQNPSAEIMEQLVSGLDLASESYVDSSVAEATQDFDAGAYGDTGTAIKKLKARKGLDAAVPTLDAGEFGFSTDTEQLYVGAANGNVPINGTFEASATAPNRTDILWIDTANGNSIKFHNGTAWTATATATFA